MTGGIRAAPAVEVLPVSGAGRRKGTAGARLPGAAGCAAWCSSERHENSFGRASGATAMCKTRIDSEPRLGRGSWSTSLRGSLKVTPWSEEGGEARLSYRPAGPLPFLRKQAGCAYSDGVGELIAFCSEVR
jgi:hypothetical protein